uniref:Polypeptide N-acetylgalactosaminyltransferase n=1 Tax=Neolamprologus brichardi TaxID=32507 RepID=A0A3Q4G6L2_NEOBR
MAVARKIKTLLTVNILVFVGIILFSVYCRIQDRSEELIQIGRISDQRLRARNGKVSNLVDRQSILQRLERLEDVVYNQLNGLAKPMGLVEGPGGLGQGGAAATLGEDSRDAERKYEEYGYNAQLSDRISLDRSIPDYRPKKYVCLCFCSFYVMYILLPATALHLFLSPCVELKFNLDQYVNKRYPGLVKIVRNSKREGLIRARIHGWNAATAPVVGFFDAHVEFNTGCINKDRRRVETPAMIGCSFVVDREYFGEIGLLDPGMEVYGGENIELGMRVWQCGGSMEVLPCARVAHIERTKKPYNNDIDYYAKRNALRAAEVWMDEYKSHVYMAWNIPMNNPGVDFGDVSERLALRKRLQCRSFRWYLEHVYPEMRIYNNTITYGEVRKTLRDKHLPKNSTFLARYSTEGLLQLGPLGSTTFLPDTKCLIDDGRGRTPSLKKCDAVSRISQRLWDFTQNGPIISRDSGRCLEVEMSKDANFGLRLVVQRCSGQKWMIRNWIKHPRH